MTEPDIAAERLADRVKTLQADDPLIRKLEIGNAEFLRTKGFDISTRTGCLGALAWLDSAGVEDAFAAGGKVESAADWYIGEARLDGTKRILRTTVGNLRKLRY